MATDSFYGIPERLSRGDPAAEWEVFDRFSRRIVGLARQRLESALNARVDAEDIAQSVLRSFFLRNRQTPFEIKEWDALWAILARITVRKCCRQSQYHRAARRDVSQEDGQLDKDQAQELQNRDPTPQEIAVFEDFLAAILEAMPPDKREWIVMRLQGYTVAEVSQRAGRTERSVYRLLDRARRHAIDLGAIPKE